MGANARTPLAERIWSRVVVSHAGCWEWQGGRKRHGYGRVRIDGASTGAHRVAWTLANGPVPEGLHVLHRCDNPPCIRPDHLFLGTPADNAEDRTAKGRSGPRCGVSPASAARGERHWTRQRPDEVRRGELAGRARLTAEKVLDIRRRHAAGESLSALGREYGVTHVSIAAVVARRSWAHIPAEDLPPVPPQPTDAELRSMRLARGWTVEDAARRVGVAASAISRWETGVRASHTAARGVYAELLRG